MYKEKVIINQQIELIPEDNNRLAALCGQCDEHIKQIESYLSVEINNRSNKFYITGERPSVATAAHALRHLYQLTNQKKILTPETVHLCLQEISASADYTPGKSANGDSVKLHTPNAKITPRGDNQNAYIQRIHNNDVNFGIGPAGTGKTYLAVACAVNALQKELVRRIILVRPAIEAGERLGFLPGDMAEKVNPYLRPLYDALHDMLDFEYVAKLIERNVIEIVPFAYMRGRTLNDSFIILDEAQNTTPGQMKMFLTRVGFGSKVVITGDMTQVDLPKGQLSGLRHAMGLLREIEGISFTFFETKDIIRHPLVKKIINAYNEDDSSH